MLSWTRSAREGFDFFTPRATTRSGAKESKVLMNILDVEVPMITALNGPVLLHSEYALLLDIVLATPQTVFQDKPHFDFGIVPGDGMHLLWPEVIGSDPGALLSADPPDPGRARRPRLGRGQRDRAGDRLLARAHEIADGIA